MKYFLILVSVIFLIFLAWLFHPLFVSDLETTQTNVTTEIDPTTKPTKNEDLPKAIYNFPEHIKCPEDYESAEEYATSFQELIDSFVIDNPNASMKDILDARLVFYVENDCQEYLNIKSDKEKSG